MGVVIDVAAKKTLPGGAGDEKSALLCGMSHGMSLAQGIGRGSCQKRRVKR